MTSATFHVIKDSGEAAFLEAACALTESLYEQNPNTQIHILCPEPLITTLDELLWVHTPDSFLPHDIEKEAPIVLTTTHPATAETVINLSQDTVKEPQTYSDIHEIVGLNDAHTQDCRTRYTAYKKSGLSVTMNKV